MSYKCVACGHKMLKASEMGTCPACGSGKIASSRGALRIHDDKPTKTKVELFVMFLLWSLLIYGIWDKLIAG